MSDPYAALQVRDFRFFVFARMFITLAIMIQAVVVGWQVYEITKDALSLGLIGLAEAIPAITVSLYAGHLADVVERKKIIVVCVSTLVVCSVALLYFTTNTGAFILANGAFPIYTVIFVSGICPWFFIARQLFVYAAIDQPRLISKCDCVEQHLVGRCLGGRTDHWWFGIRIF